MKYQTAIEILEMQGYDNKIDVIGSDLVENVNGPEDSYYCIKKNNRKWEFLCVHNERAKSVELLSDFTSRDAATRIFLLNRLSSLFLYKEVLPGKRRAAMTPGKEVSIRNLHNSLKDFHVPNSYLSEETIKNHSIRLYEEDGGWRTAYIDKNGEYGCVTLKESLSTSIRITFSRILFLYLLDKSMQEGMSEIVAVDIFTTEEIKYYISGKFTS